jgi:signal transduction histidine kinase
MERRQKMARYIELAIEEFVRIHGDASGDLEIASTQAKQIQLILTDQEKLAHVKPVMEALDLNDVVSESILVIPKSDSTDIEVELDGDLNGHKVRAHRVSLLQVISNMLVNASESIQKTSRSAGKIALTAEQESIDQKPMIRLTVRDDGAGIDQDKLKKIFRRGFTTKDSGSGGLGLHWCANAVASMGGRIRAESEGKGQGAAFHVLLPAAQEGQQS